MAGYRVKWSTGARQDLIEILTYFNHRNKSKEYSKKLLSKILKIEKLIVQNPLIGIRSDIENIRVFILSHYHIIYQIVEPAEIVIVMVWDCRKNPNDRQIEQRI